MLAAKVAETIEETKESKEEKFVEKRMTEIEKKMAEVRKEEVKKKMGEVEKKKMEEKKAGEEEMGAEGGLCPRRVCERGANDWLSRVCLLLEIPFVASVRPLANILPWRRIWPRVSMSARVVASN